MNAHMYFRKGIAVWAMLCVVACSSIGVTGRTQQEYETDGRMIITRSLARDIQAQNAQLVPNDPRITDQYHHQAMNNFQAWNSATDSSAFIFHFSSGIAFHPDLEQNVRRDLAIDVTSANGDALDREGSGTASAGLIAGVGNNGIGGAGVVWHTNLVPVKVLNDDGKGLISDFIVGMSKALDMVEAKHLNAVFFIGLSFNVDYAGAFAQFKRAKKDGVLIVVRAGDSAVDLNDYSSFPANYAVLLDNILVATSTDPDNTLSLFANRGIGRALALPGRDLDTTYLDNEYARTSGTTASAALLAGVAGLLMHHGEICGNIIARIKRTAHPVPGAGDMVIGAVDTFAALMSTAHFIPQPIASFQAISIEGIVGQPVMLDMSSSQSPKEYPLTYRIVDFGERLPSSAPASDVPKFSHTYLRPGRFVVKGVVNDGIQDSVPAKIEILVRAFENRAPSVHIHPSVIVTHLNEETTIAWKGKDNEHDPLTYDIYFIPSGTHITTTKRKLTYVFDSIEQIGDYTVRIIASDPLQKSEEATAVLAVQDSVEILEVTYDHSSKRLQVVAITNAQPLPHAQLSVKGYGIMETQTIQYNGKEITAQVFDAVVGVKPGRKISVLSTYGGSTTHAVR